MYENKDLKGKFLSGTQDKQNDPPHPTPNFEVLGIGTQRKENIY